MNSTSQKWLTRQDQEYDVLASLRSRTIDKEIRWPYSKPWPASGVAFLNNIVAGTTKETLMEKTWVQGSAAIVSVGKYDGRRLFGRLKNRREDNIKINLI
jgi:hypothetical protein